MLKFWKRTVYTKQDFISKEDDTGLQPVHLFWKAIMVAVRMELMENIGIFWNMEIHIYMD